MPPATPDFAAAHSQVIALCDHFDARCAEIMAPGYKEDTTRNEFITPFFEALGWDVRNTAHRSVYEKDVVTEKRENIAGTARSADYAFRRPGTHLTAFFVEAKKPKVDIRNHDSCHQAVLYGWNASTPLVFLTDFEQLLVLDARSCPDKTDATRHILPEHGSYTYADYRDPEKFAELWGLLARAHVAAGSLDQAAAALPKLSGRGKKGALFSRGTRPVDEEFLAQMELWREQLAKSLKRTNHHLDGDRLTSLTQRILDRLVFLRFLEDRGIERDVTFADLGQAGGTWQDFLKVSRRLDARYNGIIFKRDDAGCEDKTISIDDTAFAAVVESLRPGKSDYLFAQISVTILGSIYERFLGNVIVARDKTAIVEPKPEVRKAGGVYYTPDYIVRYIVEQTVGRCIAGKKPGEIEKLRFADIACGSGSFLVEVFASLIRYHLAWYLADGAEKWAKKGFLRQRDIDGDYVLTLAEKRRILLACVYGVDLDPSAVEVTQLSLYLRLMEDESFPSTQALFDFEKHALLPDLRDNILFGNSLIETDIADMFGLSAEAHGQILPLNLRWQFPQAFPRGKGGFDAIVGNPPYGASLSRDLETYVRQRYTTVANSLDTFLLFCERAISLLKPSGRFGYLIPSGWASTPSAAKLRVHFSETCEPTSLVMLPYDVFEGAYVDTMIVAARRMAASESWETLPKTSIDLIVFPVRYHINEVTEFETFAKHGDFQPWKRLAHRGFLVTASKAEQTLILKLLDMPSTFDDVVEVMRGIETFNPAEKRGMKNPVVALTGDLLRYEITHGEMLYVDYPPEIERQKRKQFFSGPRILLRQLLSRRFRLQASFATDFFLTNQSIQSLVARSGASSAAPDIRATLGILNSRLLSWLFCQTNLVSRRDDFPKTIIKQTREFPFPPELSADARHGELVKLVGQILAAKKLETQATDGGKREHAAKQCAALDRQIDAVVYELYGLTDAEIALVESAAGH